MVGTDSDSKHSPDPVASAPFRKEEKKYRSYSSTDMNPCKPFDFQNSPPLKKYKRNGKDVYLDPIRKILIPATPEEEVRQKFLEYLMEEVKVPPEMISVEVPMTDYRKNAKGRADIIISYYNESDDYKYPLVLIECKAPDIDLNDDVWEQLSNYQEYLGAEFICMMNGVEVQLYHYNPDKDLFFCLETFLDYYELLKLNQIEEHYYKEEVVPYIRQDFETISSKEYWKELIEEDVLSINSLNYDCTFHCNFLTLMDDPHFPLELPIVRGNLTLIETGNRHIGYGNPGGSIWYGYFRYFVVTDQNGDNQIVGITLTPSGETVNDPMYGNSKSHNYLVVTVDDYESKHNSLQLNLDFHGKVEKNNYTITHNGKMNVGRSGSVRQDRVIEFVRSRKPHLIKNGEVYLGSVPNDRLLEWNDCIDFVLNTIEYALVRDELRKIIKEERK
ncbi:MAG: type I restriction enzyme HsdR N-terminal domain-containing protein [Leptospiraceae bacterium]|nr:type I restriction enzyme HsdR N-terminal domain-containing protein [Leptospiraceae bacterium]MCP5511446.1 type I restriction enzyme HsdR N-terminal domain-containing protein [Leptospiraceae bacterium]